MIFLPSAVTLMNLGMGVVSLMLAFNHQLRLAAVFVLFSVFFDFMDGILARRLNASSEFGKELDSLADMVSLELLRFWCLRFCVPLRRRERLAHW